MSKARLPSHGRAMSPPSDVVLKATDLWFSYDGRTNILQGVNLEIQEGFMTMMLGRSGSGKTTLLKILANLIKPTKGKVEFLGKKDNTCNTRPIAYIPQNLGLIRSMTALDNVMIGTLGMTGKFSSLFKIFPKHLYDRAHSILTDLGIDKKSHKKIWNLSGGERQRVAIARALIQNPKVILADEFVSQLDPVTSQEILSVMKKLAKDKISFFITTHDTDLVGKYADRLMIMKNGQIAGDYCPAILLAEEMFEELK